MADPVHFYFDFSSSYSYFAYDRIGAVAGKHMRDLVHRPIALGAIFKERGHAPDMPGTDKGAYIFHDVERQAAMLGKPYAWPKPFPYNSIPAARGFYWLDANAPDLAQPYVAAVSRPSSARVRPSMTRTRWRTSQNRSARTPPPSRTVSPIPPSNPA